MILQTGGSAFGEISTRSSHCHRPGRGHNANVLAICADEADFRRPDAVIDPGAGFALGRGIVGSAGYGKRPLDVFSCGGNLDACTRHFNPRTGEFVV
jgi:hypothetical protein